MRAARSARPQPAQVLTVLWIGVALAAAAISWLLLAGGAARAASSGACSVPAGARQVASVGGVKVWRQSAPTPASAHREFGAAATYPSYSGCAPGHAPRVLFRDYSSNAVVVRIAGDYVGLLDRGGTESLSLTDLLTGRTTSTTSFAPSVQDNGGSEANEPGPLLTWKVASSGWLVYLDQLSDLEGFGTALVAFSESGATTLDLSTLGNVPGSKGISRVVVKADTVAWRSSVTGAHRVTLSRALLPASLPKPLPSACQLVPRSLAEKLLGPLSATPPPAPPVPPGGFWPHVRTGTHRGSCAYASAADTSQTLDVTEQRVTPATVSRQQRAINRNPRDDAALVLPGIAAVLRSGFAPFPALPEDLRLFINHIEVDVTTNSPKAAVEIEVAGLVIERALHDAPGAS